MIQDIHAHTYFSNCGRDDPEVVLEAVAKAGIEEFGFCDHNYGIGERLEEYKTLMADLKEKWSDRLTLRRGIEIATVNGLFLKEGADISDLDYCLVEHLDNEGSCLGLRIFDMPQRWGCRTGIAHTDLFAWCDALGEKPEAFFGRLAQAGIFWEMNVNYDSIHSYREHAYVKDFVASEYQQDVVRQSGVAISVGFDGHRIEDYVGERVKEMNAFLERQKIRKLEFD